MAVNNRVPSLGLDYGDKQVLIPWQNHCVQRDSESLAVSYKMRTGRFCPEVKRPDREVV